ncbi:MAG: hypothetical protein EAZ92_00620 [Candidatus Kapaibacterium sp.]|nr:MAG: hypothetical protein EAZ92_00620 [Candidatus Kapabacteria bacterium]
MKAILILIIMSTFNVFVSVKVEGKEVNRINSFKIRKSWKEITDTANVKLPLLASKRDVGTVNKSMADRFKPGDYIEISCTYEGLYDTYTKTEFKGFVKKVIPTVPLEIECEDGSYWFRKVSVYKEWKKSENPSLKTILKYLVSEVNNTSKYKFKLVDESIPELKFNTFRIGTNQNKVNAGEALQFIKDNYGIAIWFNEDELHCRLAYTNVSGRKDVSINLQGNIVKDGNKLTYREEEETQYVVEGKAILPDNTVIIAKYPENGKGDIRPYITYNAKDKSTLEKLIKAFHSSLGATERVEGYIITKLIPFVEHSDTINIKEPDFNNIKGRFLVDTTELEFTARSGIFRKIYPGIKLS